MEIFIIKEIKHGNDMPPFYGIAWQNLYKQTYVCMPIIINIIAYWIRSLYLWLRWGYRPMNTDSYSAYHEGYKKGYNIGIDKAIHIVEKQIPKNERASYDVC